MKVNAIEEVLVQEAQSNLYKHNPYKNNFLH